jgi:DNA polymerase-3 subunit gamma/tau
MQQVKALSQSEILRTLDFLAETDRELRFTSQPRLLVELAAVRICRAAPAPAHVPAERPAPRASRTSARREKAAVADTLSDESEGGGPGAEPEAVAEASGPTGLADIRRRWDELIADLRKSRKSAEAAFLRDAVPAEMENGDLVLEFRHQFHHDQMTDHRRQLVAEAIGRVFGFEVTVKCRMGPQGADSGGAQEGAAGAPEDQLDDLLSMFPGSEVED